MHSAGIVIALLGMTALPIGAQQRAVIVNRIQLTDQQVKTFELRWGVQVRDGAYRYDRVSGAWGMAGGATAGWIMPNLDLGGPLPADASRGNTGVFINGRELNQQDVAALLQITPVYRGRWWVDGWGSFGAEGGPALGNLWQLARQRGMQPGKSWSMYANGGNDLLARDENGCTYFNSRDNGSGTSTSWASPGC